MTREDITITLDPQQAEWLARTFMETPAQVKIDIDVENTLETQLADAGLLAEWDNDI